MELTLNAKTKYLRMRCLMKDMTRTRIINLFSNSLPHTWKSHQRL